MKEQITFKQRLINLSNLMKKASDDTLRMYKFGAIGLIVIILIGGWWYFKLKTLSIGLFLITIGFLIWIMIEERSRSDISQDSNQSKEIKKKPKTPPVLSYTPIMPSVEDIMGDFQINTDIGVPRIKESKQYNKDLAKELKKLGDTGF